MNHPIKAGRALLLALSFATLTLATGPAVGQTVPAAPGGPAAPAAFDLDAVGRQAARSWRQAVVIYRKTPPADRVSWGGLGAASVLALGVVAGRLVRLRKRRIIPADFTSRFLERLQDGRLDRGKALDFCELNPSPASRVALAAVKRWGRPTGDLDRAVGLAHRIEAERLSRHVGTLRRVAALAPLIGLLGTLTTLSRVLGTLGTAAAPAAWGPLVAAALWPLTAGVALATLALVAYDGLAGRVEQICGALDRVGAETIDAIALAMPLPSPISMPLPGASGGPVAHVTSRPSASHGRSNEPERDRDRDREPGHRHTGPARTPHQIRMEIPKPHPRVPAELEDDYD